MAARIDGVNEAILACRSLVDITHSRSLSSGLPLHRTSNHRQIPTSSPEPTEAVPRLSLLASVGGSISLSCGSQAAAFGQRGRMTSTCGFPLLSGMRGCMALDSDKCTRVGERKGPGWTRGTCHCWQGTFRRRLTSSVW